MRGVDVAFQCLQPVALTLRERNGKIAFRQQRRLDLRHRRCILARTHVHPDDAGTLRHLIGLGVHLLSEVLFRRHVGHVDAVAIGVELPAVIDAAEATRLVPSIEQRRAAVRAAMVHHADPARMIAECDQFLAEQHQPQRIAAGDDFCGFRRGQPILPHQIAHHGAGTDAGELFAFDGVRHGFSPCRSHRLADCC